MSRSVVVVGGGVIGLCCALSAQEKGLSVTVLERGPEAGDGCSRGNAGMVVPSHFVPLAAPGMVAYGLRALANPRSPFWVRPRLDPALIDWGVKFWRASTAAHVARSGPVLRDLNLLSRRCFEALSTRLEPDFGLVRRGLLMLCQSQKALDDEAQLAEKAHALGLQADVVDAAGAARLDPDVRMRIAGAVHFPQDCHLDPDLFLRGLTAALRTAGGRIVPDTAVTGWRMQGRRLVAAVTAAGEEFCADDYVIAGGAWTPETARALGLRLPMQAGKGYSLTLAAPRRLPALCSILTEARVAVTPMGGALRVAGTMEITGNDLSINPRRVEGIVRSFCRYFPEFTEADFSGVAPWSGLRPCSPDGLPYIGRTGRWENAVIAAGHSMMGLSLGPATGLLVAEVLAGEPAQLPLDAVSPDRYVPQGIASGWEQL
jgi:D-amino-acid dehydrogenase